MGEKVSVILDEKLINPRSFSRFRLKYGAFTFGGYFSDPEFKVDFPLVGSAQSRTNDFCGSFGREKGKSIGCLETHLHHAQEVSSEFVYQRGFDGRCLDGQAVIVPHAYHCSDPLCPICCEFWARRETSRAIDRFHVFYESEESSLYHNIHVIASVPECDWHLSYVALRKKAVTAFEMVGVDGGFLMFHPKRWSRKLRMWYFSPHWHCLGVAVDGWVDGSLVRVVSRRTGYVVRNLGRRDSNSDLARTIKYQLSHAGVPFGHSHSIIWFGVLSYRNLHVDKEQSRSHDVSVCPLCGNMLKPVMVAEGPLGARADVSILKSANEGRVCLVDPEGWVYRPMRHKDSMSEEEVAAYKDYFGKDSDPADRGYDSDIYGVRYFVNYQKWLDHWLGKSRFSLEIKGELG